MIKIDVYPGAVYIEEILIARPSRVSPKQWLEFWEQVIDLEKVRADGYKIGYDAGYREGYYDRSDTE